MFVCDDRDVDGDVGTADAALAGRARFAELAPSAGRDERGAARVAQAAIFEEALLNAMRARFAEFRMVAK
jgi:hypothetical protein